VRLSLHIAADRWRREEAWQSMHGSGGLAMLGRSSEAAAVKLLRVRGGALLETSVFLRVRPMPGSMYYALAQEGICWR
jgi:hypothetical protein